MSDAREALTPERVREILASQLPNPTLTQVELPSLARLGLPAIAYVRPVDGERQAKVMGFAAAPYAGRQQGDVDEVAAQALRDEVSGDVSARALVASVRQYLCSEDGEDLLATYAEAAAFLRLLDTADFQRLDEALRRPAPVGSVEEGKGS